MLATTVRVKNEAGANVGGHTAVILAFQKNEVSGSSVPGQPELHVVRSCLSAPPLPQTKQGGSGLLKLWRRNPEVSSLFSPVDSQALLTLPHFAFDTNVPARRDDLRRGFYESGLQSCLEQ